MVSRSKCESQAAARCLSFRTRPSILRQAAAAPPSAPGRIQAWSIVRQAYPELVDLAARPRLTRRLGSRTKSAPNVRLLRSAGCSLSVTADVRAKGSSADVPDNRPLSDGRVGRPGCRTGSNFVWVMEWAAPRKTLSTDPGTAPRIRAARQADPAPPRRNITGVASNGGVRQTHPDSKIPGQSPTPRN